MKSTSEGFKDYVLDQLQGIPGIRAKRMFGGYGLYAREKFFGIIAGDHLYFKTSDATRDKYIEIGAKPFAPSKKQVLKNYMEVLPEILESPEVALEWGIEAANL